MRARDSLIVALGTLAAVAWLGAGTFAHKAITSPFTFYDDVLPITAAQCGACHAPEGIAPMSLLSHESAVPWGESMRLELVAGHMPPWAAASPPDRFREARRLSARELNVLLTWAAGGTPPGDTPKTVEAALAAPWPLGAPHETLALPAMDLPADVARTTKEWVLPLTSFAGRRLSAVDLRPGLASVVRSARISTRRASSNAAAASERVVGLWVPADQPALLPAGAGWSIEPNAELVVRVSYRKRWDREREPASDQSAIGLYFANAAGSDAGTMTVRAGQDATGGDTLTAAVTVAEHANAVALWPEPAVAGATVRIEVAAAGGRRHLASLAPRAGWERRYWLKQPLELPAGARLEVKATWPAGAAIPAPGTALVGIDTVAAR